MTRTSTSEEREWARAKRGLAGRRARIALCLVVSATLTVGAVVAVSYAFVPLNAEGALGMYVALPAIVATASFFGLYRLLGGRLPAEYRRGLFDA